MKGGVFSMDQLNVYIQYQNGLVYVYYNGLNQEEQVEVCNSWLEAERFVSILETNLLPLL